MSVNATRICGIAELGAAIETFAPAVPWPFFLAAVLLGMKAEVPISLGETCVFGSPDLLNDQAENELEAKTRLFISWTNVLRLFTGRMEVSAVLAKYGEAIRAYGGLLMELCKTNQELQEKLADRDDEARSLASSEPLRPFEHTLALLDRLRADEDWDGLREQARRHSSSSDDSVSLAARRMLGLSLGRSTERADQEEAIAIYRRIDDEGLANAEDVAAFAIVLIALKKYAAAGDKVLNGIARFSESRVGFLEIGQRIVEATGDHAFRDQLKSETTESGPL